MSNVQWIKDLADDETKWVLDTIKQEWPGPIVYAYKKTERPYE